MTLQKASLIAYMEPLKVIVKRLVTLLGHETTQDISGL